MGAQRYKYPRTPQLPWSPGFSDDDIILGVTQNFVGREVIVTEKLDGENTSLYADHIHARSIDSRHHPSRNWVKQLHGRIAHHIPDGWRICGENVYAKHSLFYDDLDSYFFLFSIWDEANACLDWDATLEWSDLLEVPTPPQLYRGTWDEETIRSLPINEHRQEGYVVRLVDGYRYDDFQSSIAKWVRPGHVQTDQHWMHAAVVPNKLRQDDE